MGCHSGKATAPKNTDPAVANNTLLAGPQAQSKDAVKETTPEAAQPLQGIFDGIWSSGDNGGNAVIRGDKLTWGDDTMSDLRINEESKAIETTYQGTRYTGALGADGKIHWNDNDVWSRDEALHEQLEKALQEQQEDNSRCPGEAETLSPAAPVVSKEQRAQNYQSAAETNLRENASAAHQVKQDALLPNSGNEPDERKDKLLFPGGLPREAGTEATQALALAPKAVEAAQKAEEQKSLHLDLNAKDSKPGGTMIDNQKTGSAPRKERAMCCC